MVNNEVVKGTKDMRSETAVAVERERERERESLL